MKEAREAVERIGLPVVIRPAYTLGGTGGGHATTTEEFNLMAATGMMISPAVIEKSAKLRPAQSWAILPVPSVTWPREASARARFGCANP